MPDGGKYKIGSRQTETKITLVMRDDMYDGIQTLLFPFD